MTHSPVLSRAGERLAASGSSSSGIRPRDIFAPHLSTWNSPDSTNNRNRLHRHSSATHQKRSRSVRTEQETTLTRSSVISLPPAPQVLNPPPVIDPATGRITPNHRSVSNSERPNSSHLRHAAKTERSSTSCHSSSGTRNATPTHQLSRSLHL